MRARKRPASPQEKPTQHREASGLDASVNLKSKDSPDHRLLPDSLPTTDSSDENYTEFLISHTTASDSTIGNLTSSLEPPVSRVEGPKDNSKTESQFSSSMPHLEDSTPLTPITVNDSHDSVFVSDPSPDTASSVSSPETPMPIPRRTTRSNKGKPPERYGNVYTFDTLVDMGSYF